MVNGRAELEDWYRHYRFVWFRTYLLKTLFYFHEWMLGGDGGREQRNGPASPWPWPAEPVLLPALSLDHIKDRAAPLERKKSIENCL